MFFEVEASNIGGVHIRVVTRAAHIRRPNNPLKNYTTKTNNKSFRLLHYRTRKPRGSGDPHYCLHKAKPVQYASLLHPTALPPRYLKSTLPSRINWHAPHSAIHYHQDKNSVISADFSFADQALRRCEFIRTLPTLPGVVRIISHLRRQCRY